MNGADWLVDYLIRNGATDVFGIPGAVVMEYLYAFDRRKEEIMPHLTYHEQGAAFAACGYAQSTGKLGLAYATRGPGATNMITGIADAYYDSVPVMFFTAHSSGQLSESMRVLNNQEIDLVSMMAGITKYAVRIDRPEDLQHEVVKAHMLATSGRRGPVFLDILSSVLAKPVVETEISEPAFTDMDLTRLQSQAGEISAAVRSAKRPVILLGNGAKTCVPKETLLRFVENAGIPVLSSRSAQDAIPDSPLFYGFVGSHAMRYSAFILSKADLILSLGNRLSFPVNSASFHPVVEQAKILRVELDEAEFERELPNSINFYTDVSALIPMLEQEDLSYQGRVAWLAVCDELRETLRQWDNNTVIDAVMQLMETSDPRSVYVCDVGNHGFWVTTAYSYAGRSNRILYSASFGTLGCALPKSIGACYATRAPILCFTGDQGIQMNIQELNFIGLHKLPIAVVVLNNHASGMIRDRQKDRPHFVHTTEDSGYRAPDLRKLAEAYGLKYFQCGADTLPEESLDKMPCIIELKVGVDAPLYPLLPLGSPCQKMLPSLPDKLEARMDNL